MKITITPPVVPPTTGGPSRSTRSENVGFDEVLAETMARQRADSRWQTDGTLAAGNLTGIRSDMITREPVDMGLERLIDLLDTFRGQLQDPSCSPRAMEPTVKAMDRLRGDLEDRMKELHQDDPIHGIINTGLVTASMEVGRFYRGDYC
ncbi:MAG: hypothetical protein ACOWWM_05885 [Desulfobacterales bacterium]